MSGSGRAEGRHPDPSHGPIFLGVSESVTGRVWRDRLGVIESRASAAMVERHAIPELVARVMAGRGVGIDEAVDFLDPTLRRLMPDPAVLTDMEAAAERLADAVAAGERVAIFGDYDVDGATSSALLFRYLAALGPTPRIYIPDRIFEGYGPNREAIRLLAGEGHRLLVTVDCGATSHEALGEAAELGLDVVILDHHQMGAAGPPAVALVNPNRPDDLSGLGHLAAVGVTFLTLVATNRALRRRGAFGSARPEPDLLRWLDLVALGTICDVVPLKGLNRAFVTKGLMLARARSNVGLAALATVARCEGPMAPWHCGFLIGPRINAGGRIGDAALGARLLTEDDPARAEAIAVELDRLNQERQAVEAAMVEEAVAEADAEIGGGPGPAVLVTASERWHPGIVGLVAARLKERFGRPAFAIALTGNGFGTGSGRSIAGVDLGVAVRAAVEAGLLVKGGGHAMAAGLTIAREKLGAFRAFLDEHLAEQASAARSADALLVDAALTARAATPELVDRLERAGPYGAGHPEPVLAFPAHHVTYAEVVGSGHVRVTLSGGDAVLKGIAFRSADGPLGRALLAARGRPLHVAGTLSVEHWNGRRQARLRLIDAAQPAQM
ncbi:single-stranded-DNA-specific exonuclease RecJ [Prosthecomicrobium pneumaticum]|uniref:Single-stranded-DNA-specific exonuclease RecJ n=1 Tax=Prosthecomicrobium pneumaticum TaxID=81895 RepID=A0A7W9CSX4_9HYPH|nr:single-stranded-DNA-specific exonuclease RecJ [Prosthecomicrobium pneumaticum]MBB5751222.1 single-stranded-DNA-specific exonuclease [Prosthecomicrobium pneumaticum]